MVPFMIWIWIGFIGFVLAMLAFDLGLLHRESRPMSPRQALTWTVVCAMVALAVNAAIFFLYQNHTAGLGLDPRFPATGSQAAMQYFTGWLVEQSLSLDNV